MTSIQFIICLSATIGFGGLILAGLCFQSFYDDYDGFLYLANKKALNGSNIYKITFKQFKHIINQLNINNYKRTSIDAGYYHEGDYNSIWEEFIKSNKDIYLSKNRCIINGDIYTFNSIIDYSKYKHFVEKYMEDFNKYKKESHTIDFSKKKALNA